MRARLDEKKYYDSLLNWLFERGYYVGQNMSRRRSQKPYWYKDLGSKVRGDVAGVRNIGNKYFDQVEVAVIEVKDKPITLRGIQQAYGYSLFAHKCYLATPFEISEEQKDNAHEFGVGLLHMDVERKQNGSLSGLQGPFYCIEEVLSPQRSVPKSEAEMTKFLDTLSIKRCSICQCYVFDWAKDKKNPEARPRTVIRMLRGKQISGYSDEAYVPFIGRPPKKYRIHRYICLECARQLQAVFGKYDSNKSA